MKCIMSTESANFQGDDGMRLIQTEEQKSLWNAFKPYLVTNGLNVTLREDAPQEAKDAEALYSKLREKQKMQYLKNSGII